MEGWVSLYRKVMDNPVVCKDTEYFSVWVYLLLNATHKEYPAVFKGEKIILKPGQLITGRKSISEKFNISESKVQRILKTFENEHQIEQQTGNKNRLISIVKWEEYQKYEHQTELLLNNNWTTSEQQVNTNNNVITKQQNTVNKKEKEKGGINALIDGYTTNTDLRECLKDFVKMRAAKKKPMTDRAVKMLLNDLDKLENTNERKIKVLEQSIMNSWQGVFPLKEENKGGNQDESHGRNAEEERAMEEHRRAKGQWLIDNGYV